MLKRTNNFLKYKLYIDLTDSVHLCDCMFVCYRREQNFHIFYYVHDGLPLEDKNHKYHLKENATYR